MSRFKQELQVIPKTAWTIAGVFYAVAATLIGLGITYGGDRGVSGLPSIGKVALVLLPPVLLVALIAVYGYVCADAKRRGMRYVMWTLLAILIPDAIGIILYFLLRDPLPKPCTNCENMVPKKFAFCPKCGTEVQRACKVCHKPVEAGWSNCAYCGSKLAGGELRAT
jgi:RNA polymerase subunit RPABC4/transcription elongation factor Spt4